MARDRLILDTAAVAFHEKGFHGVGMDELGARAGLSGPTLYRHFPGKDAILATLLDEAMDELLRATAPSDDDAEDGLDRALDHHVAFALANRPLVTLYLREVRSLAEPWAATFAQRRGDYTRRWETLVAARFPDMTSDDVALHTQACLGALFSVASWPERVLGKPDVADGLLRIVRRGLGLSSMS